MFYGAVLNSSCFPIGERGERKSRAEKEKEACIGSRSVVGSTRSSMPFKGLKQKGGWCCTGENDEFECLMCA